MTDLSAGVTLRQIAEQVPLGFECRSCGGSAYNWLTKIDRFIGKGETCCPDFRAWVGRAIVENIALPACPVCKSSLKSHWPNDAKHNEHWKFTCGAEIVRLENEFLADKNCYRAMDDALAALSRGTAVTPGDQG